MKFVQESRTVQRKQNPYTTYPREFLATDSDVTRVCAGTCSEDARVSCRVSFRETGNRQRLRKAYENRVIGRVKCYKRARCCLVSTPYEERAAPSRRVASRFR